MRQDFLLTPLSKYFRFRKSKGDVGIEIECEGATVAVDEQLSKYWKSVPDHSLRQGGIEYVLKHPVRIDHLKEAFNEFSDLTRPAKFVHSLRCSTHIHLNVSELNLKEVYAVLSFFWLVENTLVSANGKERTGNLFCLRIKDAEELFFSVIRDIKAGDYLARLIGDEHRYSAFNLGALGKYGSLEARFLKPMPDTNEIQMWATELHNAKTSAIKLGSVAELVKLFRSKPTDEFVRHFFSRQFIKYLADLVPNWIDQINENFPYIQQLEEALQTKFGSRPLFHRPVIFTSHEDLMANKDDVPQTKIINTLSKLNFNANNISGALRALAADVPGLERAGEVQPRAREPMTRVVFDEREEEDNFIP